MLAHLQSKWMIALKILPLVGGKWVLLAQKSQQNGQTSQEGEHNDRSWQKKHQQNHEKSL